MKRKFIQYILKYLAKLILWRYQPLVIGITGSVGKTSTKEAVYTILKKRFKTARNVFNLNTEIGMPLTIIRGKDAKRNVFLWFYNFFSALWLFVFKIKEYPQILVLEMSEDAPGMTRYLVNLAKPKIGVITTIGNPPVHLKYYDDINHVIREISYLPQKLPADAKIILNADNSLVLGFKEKTVAKVLTYGFSDKANIRVTDYKLINTDDIENLTASFRLEYKGSFVPIKLKGIFGKPQIYALAAAAAVGLSLGMNLVEIAEAMKSYRIPKGRTKFIHGIEDSWILDDSYNACPDSVLAALDLLKEVSAQRKIVVLGDMKELGNLSEQSHKAIGEAIAENKIDVFVAVGKEMALAKETVIKKNPKIKVFWFENSEEAKQAIKRILQKGDLILIKGSRVMEMEKITQEIKTSK